MGTLGEDLKAARESKGISLKEISERTRISINFLKAIEEDNYSAIPGDVFVAGFLRSYARELGLKEKEVLARYRELRPPQEEQAAPQHPEKQGQQHKPRPSIISFGRGGEKEKGFPLWMIIVGGLIVAAVPAVISLYLTRGKVTPPVQPPAQVAPVKKPMAPATTAFRHATTMKQATALKPKTTTTPIPKPAATPAPAQTPQAGPLALKLTATEDTWYSVKADNGNWKSAILKKGETASFAAKDRLVLDIGNAGGVKVEFNGKALKPYGRHGEVVNGITFTRESPGVIKPAQQKKSAAHSKKTP